jgi:hypothetical protein
MAHHRKCSNCKRLSHSLKDCLLAIDGFIPGCVFCNSQDHAVDTCQPFRAMSLEEKVRLLVHERSKRPALKTSLAWWKYLRDYAEAGGTEMPTEFPWSSDFAMEKAIEDDGMFILGRQVRWDETRNMNYLPTDPKHASVKDVVHLYIGTYFWPTELSDN